MLCFVTFWCEGKQAKLRSFSAAPLSRCFRNVTWQDVFRYAPFTLAQTHHKYKRFSIHNAHKYLFCSVSLLRVAEWSRVEWNGLEWSRGHWRRGFRNFTKTRFPQLLTQLHYKTNEIWALLRRGFNCTLRLICEAWETLQNKAFQKQILRQFWASRGGAKNV